MPLRHLFAARGARHPVAYSMLTLALGMVACMAIGVWVSISASNRAIHQNEVQEQRQEELDRLQEQAQNEKAKQATCLVVRRMIQVYDDPSTPTGREAQQAWISLGSIFRCEES